MSTRRGDYSSRQGEFKAQLAKYTDFFSHSATPSVVAEDEPFDENNIKFLDGSIAQIKNQEEHWVSTDKLDGNLITIKFRLIDLVSQEIVNWLSSYVHLFDTMKLNLSKLIFAYFLFSYENNLTKLLDLVHALSEKDQGLTDFIHSIANAMNGNYIYQSTKETYLTQYNVLSFIVDYFRQLNIRGNNENIKNNASSRQIISYISDQMGVNIKTSIKKNLKILIRIYIEYNMKIKKRKKKIRLNNKVIEVRNQLRNELYTQRKIIQSVIFEYKIEVIAYLLTYLHSFLLQYYYITLYSLYIFILYIPQHKNIG